MVFIERDETWSVSERAVAPRCAGWDNEVRETMFAEVHLSFVLRLVVVSW